MGMLGVALCDRGSFQGPLLVMIMIQGSLLVMQDHIRMEAIMTPESVTALTHRDLIPAEPLCFLTRKQLPGELQRTTEMAMEEKANTNSWCTHCE